MEVESLNSFEIDVNVGGAIVKEEIKIEPEEYSENFEELYEEPECMYPDISFSEIDPLSVECKSEIQEVTKQNIVKNEEVETNIDNENIKNVLDTSISNSTVKGGKCSCNYLNNRIVL